MPRLLAMWAGMWVTVSSSRRYPCFNPHLLALCVSWRWSPQGEAAVSALNQKATEDQTATKLGELYPGCSLRENFYILTALCTVILISLYRWGNWGGKGLIWVNTKVSESWDPKLDMLCLTFSVWLQIIFSGRHDSNGSSLWDTTLSTSCVTSHLILQKIDLKDKTVSSF